MCLDYPARIIWRDDMQAVVKADGRHRRASTLLMPDVAVGDWVYVSAGHIVDRISSAEAAQITHELTLVRGGPP